MEISLENNEPSEYYNEVWYIASNYSKFIKNPRKKVLGLKQYALFLTGIALVFLIIFSFLTTTQKSDMYFYIVILFAVAFIMGIVYYGLIVRRLSQVRKRDESRKLIIENDYVEFVSGEDVYRVNKSEIKYILINKYSFCFLPKDKTTTIIFADIKYKNQILENIGEENLIVDNSDLY